MSEALETWPVVCWVKFCRVTCRSSLKSTTIPENLAGTVSERYRSAGTGVDIDESNGRRVRMAWLAVVVSPKLTVSRNCTLT